MPDLVSEVDSDRRARQPGLALAWLWCARARFRVRRARAASCPPHHVAWPLEPFWQASKQATSQNSASHPCIRSAIPCMHWKMTDRTFKNDANSARQSILMLLVGLPAMLPQAVACSTCQPMTSAERMRKPQLQTMIYCQKHTARSEQITFLEMTGLG